LLIAGARHHVIVAAAGNSNQSTAQIPASKPYIIGVAATTFERQDACFSNFGDVGAPGGNGDDKTGNPCTPLSNLQCATTDVACHERQQQNNLISLVRIRNTDETGFAYWAGTSFAAPLVSGMVARMLGSMSATQIVNGLATPISAGGLTCPITGTVKLGAGLVTLENSCP
jgi:subtilisin family serine protease